MKDIVRWSVVHVLHWAALYGAFFIGSDGAMYVLKFWIWIMAPASLLLLMDAAVADAAKKPPRPLMFALSMLQAWVTLGLLVWFGHIASALAWGLVMLMIVVHCDATRKARANAATSAA